MFYDIILLFIILIYYIYKNYYDMEKEIKRI